MQMQYRNFHFAGYFLFIEICFVVRLSLRVFILCFYNFITEHLPGTFGETYFMFQKHQISMYFFEKDHLSVSV